MTTQAQRKALIAKEITETAERKRNRIQFATADGWTVTLTPHDSVTVLATGEPVKAEKAPIGERVQVAGLGTARRVGKNSVRLLCFVSNDDSRPRTTDDVVNVAYDALEKAGLFVTFAEAWDGP